MVFGLDVFLDGVSVKDQVIEAMGDPKNAMTMKNISGAEWEPKFLKALDIIPCGYHRYYFKTKEMFEQELEASQTEGTRAEVVQKVEQELFELYKDPNLAIKPPQLENGAALTTAMQRVI